MNGVGVVVIGRNEGNRLCRSLESVVDRGSIIVYVDSGSGDGSVEVARSRAVQVVELNSSRPLSAARARNAGWQRLQELHSDIEFVQFVDGDCELHSDWIGQAQGELERRPNVAVVCGRRRERFPEASIFNRLCDVEWNTPIGETQSCGGDALMRIAALREVGGFDETVMAGEEPELCSRMRRRGWKIVRVNAEMTLHDAAMTRWGQWWRRQIRSGYGAMDVAARFGVEEFVPQVKSTRVWTLGWLGVSTVLVMAGVLLGGIPGALVGFAAGMAIGSMQVYRVARWARQREPFGVAVMYAVLNLAGKWGHLWGQVRYIRDRRRGATRLIEYKRPADGIVTSGVKQL